MRPAWLLSLSLIGAVPMAGVAKTIDACFRQNETQGVAVTLEVAETPAERRQGLMDRNSLGARHGMLFIYPSINGPERGFWMRNTLIPLEIAYLNPEGRIGSIVSMAPCPDGPAEDCPTYPAGVPFQYAVEMNAGFFDDQNIAVGHRLTFSDWASVDCPDS